MINEERYQELLDKWSQGDYEDRHDVVEEFKVEPSWWVGAFVVDICRMCSIEDGAFFCDLLSQLDDD